MDDILIVEDDFSIREDVAWLLELEGYAVKTASDGEEALEYLRSSPSPKVIILDLMMPVMDGWGFRYVQYSDPSLAHIPVIVMTSLGDSPELIDTFKASGCVRKPFPFQMLLSEIHKAIAAFPAH